MQHLWNKLHLLGKILLNLRSDHRAAGELRRVGDTVAVPVLHVRGGSHHVPAADAVLVALLLYCGVEQPLYIAGCFTDCITFVEVSESLESSVIVPQPTIR